MGCASCFGHRRPTANDKEDLPRPVPPKRRKKFIFNVEKYRKADKHAAKVSQKYLNKTFSKLVNHLTKAVDGDDEIGRVRVLFAWMTNLNLDDVLARVVHEGTIPRPESPMEFLSNLKSQLTNYAHLFKRLCDCADIPCVVLTGINKNASFEIGYQLKQEGLRAQWNAVYVCGEWRLLDVYWASCAVMGRKSTKWVVVNMDRADGRSNEASDAGNKDEDNEAKDEDSPIHMLNEFFFLTDPDMFICTHFPDESQWQLLPHPVSLHRFESYVYVREKFFSLGLQVNHFTKKYGVIETKCGEVEFGFSIPKNKAQTAAFRFLLYNNKEEFKFDSGYTLEHYVVNQIYIDFIKFIVRFPRKGTFRFDLFGREDERDMFDLVCSYVIECKKVNSMCLPLPYLPSIGWGPSVASIANMGLRTSLSSATIIAQNGRCQMHISADKSLNVKYAVLASEYEDWLLKKCILVWREGDKVFFQTRFREEGEYALRILAAETGLLNKLKDICNYLIIVKGSNNLADFPLLRGYILGPTDLAETFSVKPVSHESAFIKSNNREISLTMSMDEDVEMLAEITNNDVDSSRIYKDAVVEQTQGEATFTLSLPGSGEYGINLYVRHSNDPLAVYHIYTYYVEIGEVTGISRKESKYSENIESDGEIPSNDSPKISDETETEASGLVLPVTVVTGKSKVTARVLTRKQPMMCELIPGVSASEPIEQLKLSSKTSQTDTLFTIDLPHPGTYELNIFEAVLPGFLQMFSSYIILRGQDEIKDEAAELPQSLSMEERQLLLQSMKREEQIATLRRTLKVAMHTKNKKLLKQTIIQIKALQIPDEDGMTGKAEQLLNLLIIKDELSTAMSRRDRHRLEWLLSSVTTNDINNDLAVEVGAAKRLLEYLKRLDRLRRLRQQRHDVMNLDASTMAEIRSYSQPPVTVHLVMVGTCILLGEHPSLLEDWTSVKKIISQSGKMSLQSRVFNYDLEKLTADLVSDAQYFLGRLELEDVLQVSPAAATFYVWATGIIEEAEIQFKKQWEEAGDFKKRRPSRNLLRLHEAFDSYYFALRGDNIPIDEFEETEATFASETENLKENYSIKKENGVREASRSSSSSQTTKHSAGSSVSRDTTHNKLVRSRWNSLTIADE